MNNETNGGPNCVSSLFTKGIA